MRLRVLVPLIAIAALVAAAPAGAATAFQLGTGAHPDVAVEASGLAHVVWDVSSGSSSTPDALHYCQVPRGATACSKQLDLHPPLEAIGRSSYVFTPSPGRVVIVTYRCCGTGEGNWAYQSTDDGNSFDAGHLIGNLDAEQGMVFGPGDAVTGTTTSEVQRMPLSGPPATTTASLDPGFVVPTYGAVALTGGTLVHGAADGDHQSFNRLTGADPNSSAGWSGQVPLDPVSSEVAAGGPAGLVLGGIGGTPGATVLRVQKFTGTGFGPSTAVSETGDPIFPDLFAESGGRFHAVWIDNRTPNSIRWATSTDGTTWNAQTIVDDPVLSDDAFNLQVAAADNQGLVVWDGNGSNTKIGAAPLVPIAAGTAANTPVASVTVNGTEIDFFAPSGCVKGGSKVTLRVTSKQKKKLSPKQRVKIKQVLFALDKKLHTDKKAAFKATFPTRGKGFAKGSKHKVSGKVQLVPAKGKGKKRTVTLRGKFTICTS